MKSLTFARPWTQVDADLFHIIELISGTCSLSISPPGKLCHAMSTSHGPGQPIGVYN